MKIEKKNLPPSFEKVLAFIVNIDWFNIFERISQFKKTVAFLTCIDKWATNEQKKEIARIYAECLAKELQSQSTEIVG